MNELEYSLICPNLKIQKLSDLISFVFKRLKWAEQERGGQCYRPSHVASSHDHSPARGKERERCLGQVA